VAQIIELHDKKPKGFIKLRVGNELFITKASILCSVKDTFFQGLLNHETERINEDEYFIPRDNNSFKYVLEFLSYGKLISQINDTNILKKLVEDADYYLIGELKEAALKQLNEQKILTTGSATPRIIAKWCATGMPTSSSFWNWNAADIPAPTSHFTLTNSNTVTFKVAGLYQITVTINITVSSNGYCISLYLNGSAVATNYTSDPNGYSMSWHMNEIISIKANDTLQIYQTHNGSIVVGQVSNKLTILML